MLYPEEYTRVELTAEGKKKAVPVMYDYALVALTEPYPLDCYFELLYDFKNHQECIEVCGYTSVRDDSIQGG